MAGILYGVGVGPGDPELMTLKAVRMIRENTVIALPGKIAEETVAYKIALQAVPELAEKYLLPIYMPMTHNKEEQQANHKKGAEEIEKYLEQGENVIFLTLGDVSIYSTFTYLQRIVEEDGYETRMISGIPSFCAAAARINEPLAIWQEKIHIIPAVHESGDLLTEDGNYIFMKSGKRMQQVKDQLRQKEYEVIAVENCGMENEKIYRRVDEIPDDSGYYSLVIAKAKKEIRIGSRESRLAVVQSQIVQRYIEQHTDVKTKLVTMKTSGDKILDRTLDEIGGKGLFVKELDIALMNGEIDLSIHSLKDMPSQIPEELPILGYSPREDARDVLVLPKGVMEFDRTKPIGCSSRRRTLQARKLYPDCTFAPIRGNVPTRLEKLDRGEYGALILAAAGLKRLGLEERISRYFEITEILPAAGQGILAVQGRSGEDYSILEGFFDQDMAWAAIAERAFVKTLDGGCSSPIAAYATVEGELLTVTGLYYKENPAGDYQIDSLTGKKEEAEELGVALAERFL